MLSVLVSTAEANAQLAQFGGEVPAKLAPVQTALNDATAAVSGMTKEMAVGQQGAVELGTVMNLAGETSRESMYQARGEAGLLGEMFGIHLPRHVRSFIAELPGVGTALSAAFQATAVLFIIEAIAKGIEKIIEWRAEASKIQIAQEDFDAGLLRSLNALDEKLLRSGAKLDELRGDHMEALRKELELIDRQSLDQLGQEFEKLAKLADVLFKNLETSWFTFQLGSKGAEAALRTFQAQYELLIAQGKDKEAGDLLVGTRESARKTLELMDQFEAVKKKIQSAPLTGSGNLSGLLDEQVRLEKELETHKVKALELDDKAIQAQRDTLALLDTQVKAQEKIDKNARNEKEAKNIEEANKIVAEQEKVLKAQLAEQKRADEEQDKLEEERRNKFIADFQQEEKEKLAAAKQGSEERIRIIDQELKENEAHGFQDTAFYKSLQLQKIQAVQARIDQEQKAENKATADALKNDEQEGKREVDAIKQSSTEQQKAIADLGKAKLVSQADESRRLVASYEDEKNKVLAVLEKLLSDEQALMQKAAARLEQAKLTPGITPEQVQQAETLLGQIKNAVANTEAQIEKTKTDARVKELAADRTFYGQALAIAVAFGKQELAEKLRSNHAALLVAQSELVEAKARGVNTKAIETEIKALQHSEVELQKEARQIAHTDSVWRLFVDSFKKGAAETETAAQKMANVIIEAKEAEKQAMLSAIQAWILGQKSFGQALAEGTAQVAAQVAAQSLIYGLYYLAHAIADTFWNPPKAGAEYAAAGEFFALAAGFGGAAAGLSHAGGGSSGAGSGNSGSAAPASNSPGIAAGNQPAQTFNVLHLASGGLVSQPTMAVVGDSGPEAAIPLRDRSALQAIANAITSQMHGGGQELHLHIKTDLPGFVKVLNHGTKSGKWRVHSSTSDRAIKKT